MRAQARRVVRSNNSQAPRLSSQPWAGFVVPVCCTGFLPRRMLEHFPAPKRPRRYPLPDRAGAVPRFPNRHAVL